MATHGSGASPSAHREPPGAARRERSQRCALRVPTKHTLNGSRAGWAAAFWHSFESTHHFSVLSDVTRTDLFHIYATVIITFSVLNSQCLEHMFYIRAKLWLFS